MMMMMNKRCKKQETQKDSFSFQPHTTTSTEMRKSFLISHLKFAIFLGRLPKQYIIQWNQLHVQAEKLSPPHTLSTNWYIPWLCDCVVLFIPDILR